MAWLGVFDRTLGKRKKHFDGDCKLRKIVRSSQGFGFMNIKRSQNNNQVNQIELAIDFPVIFGESK